VKTHWRDGERAREVELAPLGKGRWRVRVDDAEFELLAEVMPDGRLRLVPTDGRRCRGHARGNGRFVRLGTLDFVLDREASGRSRAGGTQHAGSLEAPMPGVVTKVMVVVGDEVAKGQPLVAIEAMKMEHQIRAPRAGRVKRVAASPGLMVQSGAVLVELDDATGKP
jgi:acetyl/propionyl-CoA carboxylase alpha subunit